MNTVTTRVQIENLGFKRADRLLEGEWIVVGDRVGTVTDAAFRGDSNRDVEVRVKFLGNTDEYGVPEQVHVVPRQRLFPCVNVTAGLVE